MPRPPHAFVTLLTSDSYLAGALVTLASLQDTEPDHAAYDTVCLVTPATLGHAAIQAVQKRFDFVIGVEEITTSNWEELDLLGRRDLAAALTKLHLFRLTQYEKIIYLDADTLVLKPLSHLFRLDADLSASPDQGWPDAFNSGVMVCRPSNLVFGKLMDLMSERGSWDGADQGLLNDFFPDWNRLSFTYNVTPSAFYTYAPAYRRHGLDVSVLHFIGPTKPWTHGSRSASTRSQTDDYHGLINKWYDVFERHFGANVPTSAIGTRLAPPPSTFKSHYSSLPAVALPLPISMPQSTASIAWDPARSSPPKSSLPQMAIPFPTQYINTWDSDSPVDPLTRFVPPAQYPALPTSTHEWYKYSAPPNPALARPIFPWETPVAQFDVQRITKSTAVLVPERRIQYSAPPPPPQPLGGGFSNAWDHIAGINKYARSFSKANAAAAAGQDPGPAKSGNGHRRTGSGNLFKRSNDLGGRTSSLREPKAYEKRGEGDASSRDGDDEDDSDEVTDPDDDRKPIQFKAKSRAASESGRSEDGREPKKSPTLTSTGLSLSPHTTNHYHSSHPHHHHPQSSTTQTPLFSPSSSSSASSSNYHTSPHPVKSALQVKSPVIVDYSSSQLAAQAIRNRQASLRKADNK